MRLVWPKQQRALRRDERKEQQLQQNGSDYTSSRTEMADAAIGTANRAAVDERNCGDCNVSSTIVEYSCESDTEPEGTSSPYS